MALMIAAGLLLRGLAATYTVDPGLRITGERSFALARVRWLGGYGPEELEAVLQGSSLSLQSRRCPAWTRSPPHRSRIPWATTSAQIGVPPLKDQSESESRVAQARTPFHRAISRCWGFRSCADVLSRTQRWAARQHRSVQSSSAQSTARNLWASSDPIGRTLVWENKKVNTLHVVGVVADAQVSAIGQIDPYYVYVPGGRRLAPGQEPNRLRCDGCRASARP